MRNFKTPILKNICERLFLYFRKLKKKIFEKWTNGKSKTQKNQKSQESRKNYSEFSYFRVFDFAQQPKSKSRKKFPRFPRFPSFWPGHFIGKFWRSFKFWDIFLLIFLQSLKTSANVPSLFISFNTFLFTRILLSSVCLWSACLLTSEYFVMFSAYVFMTNMVAKIFSPDKQID